jgi:hypothetical protein
MDNPEPNPTVQNLKNQYISLLKQDSLSPTEAETITTFRFNRWSNLRSNNPDKLSWIMGTKNLTDENIYIYMIALATKDKNFAKINYFQYQK